MYKLQSPRLKLLAAIVALLLCPATFTGTDQPAPNKEQIKHFLLTAKVVDSRPSTKGITHTSRLTLSDGTLTHDASFQPIDEHKANFVDSYQYNLAAYALAELVDFDDMMPVYVERKWKGTRGSLSWWLQVKMDEAERRKQKLEPPDPDAWNKQMYKIRVFDELVQDTDPNLTNVLIGEDWKLWRIDFTRAFRTSPQLMRPNDLVRCDRQLHKKLTALTADQLAEKVGPYLTKTEMKSLLARRDAILQRFQQLIAEKGESEVLY
jgi:hypothetical protein